MKLPDDQRQIVFDVVAAINAADPDPEVPADEED